MAERNEQILAALNGIPNAASLDGDMRDYLVEMVSGMLEDADGTSEALKDELKEAVGPMLEECEVDDDTVDALCAKLTKLLSDDPDNNLEGPGDGKDYIVQCRGIRLGFGARMLLQKTDLLIERGHRYGLVGDNGIGKTTLLTRVTKGDIMGWPSHMKSVYVQHEVLAEAEVTVIDFALRGAPEDKTKADCLAVLPLVGFDDTMMEGMVNELSGGWRMKLAIACAMLQDAKFIMLDEPTNHLDVNAVKWLENYLCNLSDTTILFVSHDQDFLRNVATDIIHFADKELSYYPGYDVFRKEQPDAAMGAFKAFQLQQEIAKEMAAGGDLSALEALEGEDLIFKFPHPGPLDGVNSRSKPIMRMDGMSFAYPASDLKILTDVSVRLTQTSRIAIVGANGAGKTTLLRLLIGELYPRKGQGEVWRHHALRVAYVAQHSRHHLESCQSQTPVEYIQNRFFLGEDKEIATSHGLHLTEEEKKMRDERGNVSAIVSRSVRGKTLMYECRRTGRKDKDNTWEPLNFLQNMPPYVMKMVKRFDEVMKAAEGGAAIRPLTGTEIRKHLADFQIGNQLSDNPIKGFSGGQKSRLVLAAAMWNRPHILALDEPTNYLDQEALGALARSITNFQGGVLMVSHNKDFVSQVCNEAWLVKDSKVMCNAKKENGESIFTMTAVEGMTEYKQKKESGKPARKEAKEKKEEAAELAQGEAKDEHASLRSVTGNLASQPNANDLKFVEFSMAVGGKELIAACNLEFSVGRRYGLIGMNGCGKSNFLHCLSRREIPIPDHIDLYHLQEEAEPTDRNALESVVDHIKAETKRLQEMEEKIITENGPDDERLQAIYDRLDELNPETFETRAAELLHGLGFNKVMMAKATRDMSGGWRMRVSLARALFAAPALLLLDEPTNHLDLEACVWLEAYLQNYSKCLVLISHSQDFLNGVCTNIIEISNKSMNYYSGNYDTYRLTRAENENIQMKKYEKEQEEIKHIKDFIASCGTYANMMKQAKSKQKILDKMEAAGLTKPVENQHSFELNSGNIPPAAELQKTFQFQFPTCDKLPPPVLPFDDVAFSYTADMSKAIYKCVNLGVDCDSRIALVGPNGAGKSTLLKMMAGELTASSGTIKRHPHLSIARYHQHSTEQLEGGMTVLDYFADQYPGSKTMEDWRGYVGRFGFSGSMQTTKIKLLSEGQKSRLIFAVICMGHPNLLLLDEPTNHLDIDAIDALADAIKGYKGGLVLVSHDFRLIDQVAEHIWVCDKGEVTPWKGSIREYKAMLAKKMGITSI